MHVYQCTDCLASQKKTKKPIEISDPELSAIVGEAKFFSITYRLFKLPGTEYSALSPPLASSSLSLTASSNCLRLCP